MPRKKVTNEYNQTLREETEIKLRSLAKRMNQRLRQLEKSGLTQSSKAYGRIELWGYNQSKEFLTTTGKGEIKFKTSTKGRTTRQLQAQIRQMEIFANANTSTVSGIKKSYTKSYQTFKKKSGYTGSFTQYSQLVSEDAFSWAVRNYGSERTLAIVREIGTTRAIELFTLARLNNWSYDEVHRRAFGDGYDDIDIDSVVNEGESFNL